MELKPGWLNRQFAELTKPYTAEEFSALNEEEGPYPATGRLTATVADLRAQLQTAQQERETLHSKVISYSEDARHSEQSNKKLFAENTRLEQAIEARGQEADRLKDMLRAQICHACETRIGWEGTKMVCLVCSGVRAALATPAATPATQPCPDCDTGYPEGRMCQTCKGTSTVAPSAPHGPGEESA